MLTPPIPQPAAIQIQVDNVATAQGHVRVQICTEAEFLKDCAYSGEAPARPGPVAITIRGVTPGRYAIQAFQDANDNHKVDQGLLGIPKEGVGFSNTVIRFGKPKFREAAFDHGAEGQIVHVTLRYFTR